MRNEKQYKIIVWVLSAAVIIETALVIYLAAARFKKIAQPPVLKKGKIAIVLDDWGYNLNNLAVLEEIKYPLTVSVLPNLKYSAVVSERAHGHGDEVILHLPMEPYEKFRLENNTIMISMDQAMVINILDQDLSNIVYAKGVSNHMGSRATADEPTMKVVLSELKRRRLYFLDSFVSPKSLAYSLAAKAGLSFARRDIFLDNNQDPGYIKTQVEKLKARSTARGYAIGIGHDRKATLEVLREVMPQLKKEGYEFVPVSELVK